MSNNYAIDERKSAMKRAVDLITDMTVNGATPEELERAILWSADVVRSNKEDIDWKQSYEDYVIVELEDKYQEADMSEYDKDYLVIDENYHSPHGIDNFLGINRGLIIAGFDTREEAEALVKEMNNPGLVILGPKVKGE